MAFITTTAPQPTFSLGDLPARLLVALRELPLGEERFTGSTHAAEFSAARTSDGRPEKAEYRLTFALRVV